jgi:hypothetical protein
MAIWQCSFLLVPVAALARSSGPLLEWAQSSVAWADTQPSEEVERVANEVLGRSPSWSSDVDIWGDESSTCLTISREDGHVVEVLFRVDMRSIQKTVLARLLDGFLRAGVLLISESGQRCQPTLPAIRDVLEASPSWRYVQDPQAFLVSLYQA